MTQELVFRSATELTRLIRNREVSSRELVDAYLARIERLNPQVNAVVTLDAARARRRADAADAALALEEIWGPLHGVPITIKDTLETAGLRTTAGYPPLAEHVPATDAPVVRRMLDAGAVLMGKTNSPVLAGDWQSYNPIFGTTNNPWDTGRVPGGSSGGSAAALAAGLTGLEIGSDIAGSIRVPAHWCGVYGHKPTHGIVPLRGHIPGPPGTLGEADLAVAGPLARSAGDLDLALGVTAGPLDDRAVAWRLELPPPRRQALREYRVAAWLDDRDFPVDHEVTAALRRAVDALRKSGVAVDEAARPGFGLAEALDMYLKLLWPILTIGLPPETQDALRELAEQKPPATPSHRFWVARYGTARHQEWLFANEARARLRAQLAAFFRDYDVLLCPVNQVAAIPHDQSEPMLERTVRVNGEARPYYDLMAWISIATLTWHPATSAPVGRTRDGLPVGLQIVGPYLEDRTPIDFARQLANVVGGFEVPPGFPAV